MVPTLENVTVLKMLGLVFNLRLTWSDHLTAICLKFSRRLFILGVLKPLFYHDQLIFVFNHIIRSIIEYASPVLHTVCTVVHIVELYPVDTIDITTRNR